MFFHPPAPARFERPRGPPVAGMLGHYERCREADRFVIVVHGFGGVSVSIHVPEERHAGGVAICSELANLPCCCSSGTPSRTQLHQISSIL